MEVALSDGERAVFDLLPQDVELHKAFQECDPAPRKSDNAKTDFELALEKKAAAEKAAAEKASEYAEKKRKARECTVSSKGSNLYLCTLLGLITRQQHYPASALAQHIKGTVRVAFWLDERGGLTRQAVYGTSGNPELDAEAVAAIRRAAPFPPPPPDQPRGFVAAIEFPPK